MRELNNLFVSSWLVSVVEVVQLKGFIATAAKKSLQP